MLATGLVAYDRMKLFARRKSGDVSCQFIGYESDYFTKGKI